MASISKGEQGDKLRRLADLKDEEDKIRGELGEIDTIQNWVSTMPIMDDYEVAMSVSKKYNMNVTEAKSQLDIFPKEYRINEKTIPTVVKELKKHRRTLKGEEKVTFTKAIENLKLVK